MTGSAIACGSSNPRFRKLFPYPKTENWQKAIGAHWIWMSAAVSVSKTADVPTFSVLMIVHVEDRYNFNPGAADINTKILDKANGRFEVSGLAKQYMNYSILVRHLRWTGWTRSPVGVSSLYEGRARMPADNLWPQNRL
jgi:hypothetical protein